MHYELTPSERGYLFNRERFLKGIKARGDALFDSGYRAHPTLWLGVFRLSVPSRYGEGGSGKTFLVNAGLGYCACPFYEEQADGKPLGSNGEIIPCKHLEGIEKLVRMSHEELKAKGDDSSCYLLRVNWISVLAVRRRREIAESGEAA